MGTKKMTYVKAPFGDADVQSLAYAATVDVKVTNQVTIVNVAQMTGALALTATIDADVKPGAVMIVKLQSDGTARACTPGAGFTSTAISGVISKTKYAQFMYDGSTFVNLGSVQVD